MKSWGGSLNSDDQARLEGLKRDSRGDGETTFTPSRRNSSASGVGTGVFGTEIPAIPSPGFAVALALGSKVKRHVMSLAMGWGEGGVSGRG